MHKTIKLLFVILTLVLTSLPLYSLQASSTPPQFLRKWGSYGAGDGQFFYPFGIAVDTSGNVYVVDTYNNRIQKFDNNGTFLAKWGSRGSGNGQFDYPCGIAVDASGNVYVADTSNNRIQKLDSSGGYLAQWGSWGTGEGQFYDPYGIAVDISGNVYVADTENHRIQKFNSSGGYLAKWGSSGAENGQFKAPFGIAVDTSGEVYVSDTNNNRIQKFNSSGTFITKWGSSGSGNGQFRFPWGIAVDTSGNLYVADCGNHRIQKFDSNGIFLTKWGSYGIGDEQFRYPAGIAVDTSSEVYVVDTDNHRIQVFGTPPDTTPPTGSIFINSGDTYTNNLVVTLALYATDDVNVDAYRVANGTDASGGDIVSVGSASPYTANIAWTLPGVDGSKTLAVQYRDTNNNWSINYTDTIILDTTLPTLNVTLFGRRYLDGYLRTVRVTLSASDTNGITPPGIEWSANGTTWSTYTAPFFLSGPPNLTLYYRVSDNTSNLASKTLLIKFY